MTDNNKMPSLSLDDYKNQQTNSTISQNNYVSNSDCNSQNPQTPYWVNAAEVNMINGRMPKPKIKKHTGRNVFISVLCILIAALIGTYCFLPKFKNNINATFKSAKPYLKWSADNTIDLLIGKNNRLFDSINGSLITISGNGKNSCFYNSSTDFYSEFNSKDKNPLKVYVNKQDAKSFIMLPSDKDSWYSLDSNSYNGKLSNLSDFDYNTYFTNEELKKYLSKYADICASHMINPICEKNADEFVNGKVYSANKISTKLTGNQFLKFVSDFGFALSEDEKLVKYIENVSGITQRQILDMANDANMTRQGVDGFADYKADFDFYVNEYGIFCGFDMFFHFTDKELQIRCLYGQNEYGADLDMFIETDKIRNFGVNLTATFDENKSNGTFSYTKDGEKKIYNFSDIEFLGDDILSGVNGQITYDNTKTELSFSDEKQHIKSNGENAFEYTIEIKKNGEFTPPEINTAKFIFSDDTVFDSFKSKK